MNLFIIPSEYPSKSQPLGGIFTQEQAAAIAELCSDIKVIISTWGHSDGDIPIRHPQKLLDVLKWRFYQHRNQIRQRGDCWEVFNPTINWSHRLPFGGINRLLAVNRRNYGLAIKTFGKIDLIHAHFSYPAGYIAYILSQEFNIPYVLTEHMSPFPFPFFMHEGKPWPEIELAFAHAAQSIAVSQSLKKRLVSFGYKEPMVVPNIVDERRFFIGEPTSQKFIFFTLCGMTDQKGINHLLEAIALWNPPVDQFQFRIGGDGPMLNAYKKTADRLRISNLVQWLGAVSREDAPLLFREAHIYVMPSLHESFGVVYAEAIASGKPIIATRCGGPEFIVNENNGRLIDIGDVNELSQTMQEMAEHWAQYSPLVIRKDFEQRFSRPAVVAQLRTLYETVIKI